MFTGVASSLVLITVCIAQITWVIGRRKVGTGRLILLAPSVVFVVGVLARFGVGSLLVGLTPEEHVLNGEYRQYIVSWLYSGDTARLWTSYIVSGGIVFGLLDKYKKNNRPDRTTAGEVSGWLEWIYKARSKRVDGYKGFKALTCTLLLIYFASSCISAWTGSMDRGANYSYWAELTFRPEAIFIAFARLRQIGYFLLPLTWKLSSRRLRLFMLLIALLPLIMELIAGGRGSVLYPIVMVFAGYLCTAVETRKVLIYGVLLVSLIGVAVPYIAAYRDSAAMGGTSHRNIRGRLGALLTGVEGERVVYRYMALGREVYACSDGFVVEAAEEKGLARAGISDLKLESLGRILLPRWISKDKKYEKADSASIAKGLMGVEKRNWYPCITTPADLFRRERWRGVIGGGALMGAILWFLDSRWLELGRKKRNLETLLVTVLPITYIQAGMYGTVRELVWQIAWELPKYIVLFWGINKVVRYTELISRRVKD